MCFIQHWYGRECICLVGSPNAATAADAPVPDYKVGDRVCLAEGYMSPEAQGSSGPLVPGDVGEVIASDGTSNPYLVRFNGEEVRSNYSFFSLPSLRVSLFSALFSSSLLLRFLRFQAWYRRPALCLAGAAYAATKAGAAAAAIADMTANTSPPEMRLERMDLSKEQVAVLAAALRTNSTTTTLILDGASWRS